MKRNIGFGIAALLALAAVGAAAAQQPAPVAPNAAVTEDRPMVPPAGPGVFTAKKSGPNTFHLVVAGHKFVNRGDIEKYLAYRAARLTIEQKGEWFTFVENRAKGETADPAPKLDLGAPRFSFRMKYFRPVWRFKTSGSPTWTRWSPFSGAPFNIAGSSDFEVSADIVVHKDHIDDANSLAFEAWALSDFLINQVSPPT